jgi:hypothetical protein
MVFLKNGSIFDIFGIMCLGGLCIGFLCFSYRIIFGLFCYNGTKIYERNQNDNNELNNNQNENDIVSISNIIPFMSNSNIPNVSCVNIQDDFVIDNEKNLPIATIV